MKWIERAVILLAFAYCSSVSWVVIEAVATHEPYVNAVCRDEFGHRRECDETEG